MKTPVLLVFLGRPGVGKTTLARRVAQEIRASYFRIDTIENGLRASALGLGDLRDGGYAVGYELAADALSLGQCVVADAVNPDAECRAGWASVAEDAGATLLWVHVICSDPGVHRARINARLEGGAARGADWSEVSTRAFDPVPESWLTIDTAREDESPCAAAVLFALENLRRESVA